MPNPYLARALSEQDRPTKAAKKTTADPKSVEEKAAQSADKSDNAHSKKEN